MQTQVQKRAKKSTVLKKLNKKAPRGPIEQFLNTIQDEDQFHKMPNSLEEYQATVVQKYLDGVKIALDYAQKIYKI